MCITAEITFINRPEVTQRGLRDVKIQNVLIYLLLPLRPNKIRSMLIYTRQRICIYLCLPYRNAAADADVDDDDDKDDDDYLCAGTRYLCGDSITHLDCLMLPKLQHIRVAAYAFKDLHIPQRLTSLWRYLATAYSNDTFRKTCPSDQEIVYHWSEKRETTPLPESKKKYFMLEAEPRFTWSVPQLNGN